MANKPEKKFRAGAVSATIWKNERQDNGKTFAFHTISLERGYKDKAGEWKTTSSLRTADLPKASLVLGKAYEYLILTAPEESGSVEENLAE
ncbi:MAG: hypothetical protein QW666_03420 [Candidatus Woesearchaeota archaeon]